MRRGRAHYTSVMLAPLSTRSRASRLRSCALSIVCIWPQLACGRADPARAREPTSSAAPLSEPDRHAVHRPAPPLPAIEAPNPPSGASTPSARPGGAPNARSPLGTNLDGVNDWSPEWAFVDAHKRSRAWISSTATTWDDHRPFELDDQGWVRALKPGQLARSLIFWDTTYPSGTYVVLYDGAGKLRYEPQGKVLAARPGRELVQVDAKKGNFGLLIAAEPKSDDPLRNVRVLMPGGVCASDPRAPCDERHRCAKGACVPFEQNYEQQIFHPRFLERIQRFSVVRFMDWMRTNDSKERAWKDRPQVGDARWRDGVPLEIMVELANRLSQHPWFNMPHAADDEYVRQFATYVRDHLKPELKVYVEYSNEVWNGMFPQASYAVEQGKKLGLGESDWDAQYRFHAQRSTEIHKIWESVFEGPHRRRLVRVLGTQVANFGVAEALLGYKDTRQHVDALAVAPYFGGEYGAPEEAPRWRKATVDQLLDDIEKRSLPQTFAWTRAHAELAKKLGLELIAYEGGESLQGLGPFADDAELNKLFDQAGRHPRMKQVYLAYLEGWRKAGGKLFVHFTSCFTPGKFGRWGALESLDQPREQAPKYDALLTFIEKNPRWW